MCFGGGGGGGGSRCLMVSYLQQEQNPSSTQKQLSSIHSSVAKSLGTATSIQGGDDKHMHT
jgi:hypothetical protein